MLLLLFSQNEAVVAPEVPLIPPGGGGRKRKTLRLRTLTDDEIRKLKEKIHRKRRTIWERPKPEETTTKKKPLAAKAYVDTSFRETREIAAAVVDLARVRAELEAERQARWGVNAQAREARIAALRVSQEEEAVIALLLAA